MWQKRSSMCSGGSSIWQKAQLGFWHKDAGLTYQKKALLLQMAVPKDNNHMMFKLSIFFKKGLN